MNKIYLVFLLSTFLSTSSFSQRPRDLGIKIGVIPTGKTNTITDVAGVSVGHVTKIEGESVRTGVTAILPHGGNIFQSKVPAAIYVGNGFGKLAGSTQVVELGNIETPILLTNTLNVGRVVEAVVEYTLAQPGNESVRSVNAVVGETNDGYLNDIRGMHVTREDVWKAINDATSEAVVEGNIGAGTGTIAFGFKGGIGSASRKLPESLGGYSVGVLVQSNFGGVLTIDGVGVGEELSQYSFRNYLEDADGSCMIVIATDAPLDARNLTRLAKRAMLGFGRTGAIGSNGSGDYVIAFSTDEASRVPYQNEGSVLNTETLHNDYTSPVFMAAAEATEEAIINSLFAAETMTGNKNRTVESLPIEEVLKIMKIKK